MKNMHLATRIRTNLLSATLTALIGSQIAFAIMARAEDPASTHREDFEVSTQWVNLSPEHGSYHWLEKGGVDDSACLVIERENKSDYETLGILKLINPEPGTYRLSVDMKVEEFGEGPFAGAVFIDLYKGDEYVAINPNSYSRAPTGGAWVTINEEVVIPEGITNGWVGAVIPKGWTGKVFFDNLVFQKIK
jgi:hypothetical protein